MVPGSLPTLAEARFWFKNEIIPKRTASAGFSGNRLWKSPLALIRGNVEDPNGLCGDAAWYVCEAYFTKFGDYTTSDGHTIGLVLWEGAIQNHIANVMLLKAKVGPELYSWNAKTRTVVPPKVTVRSYGSAELLRLEVFDLYYKNASTLQEWWQDLDGMGGTIKIAQLHSIGD